jgi:hypothetical protein
MCCTSCIAAEACGLDRAGNCPNFLRYRSEQLEFEIGRTNDLRPGSLAAAVF